MKIESAILQNLKKLPESAKYGVFMYTEFLANQYLKADTMPFCRDSGIHYILIHHLLNTLCIEWGFCIPPETADLIARNESIGSDEFAEAVLRVEGMNIQDELIWFKRIKARYLAIFDSDDNLEMKDNTQENLPD